jgi:hypothetical protein
VGNIFRVVSLVEQFMAEFSAAELEEARTMAIAKLVSSQHSMASRIHRPP